MYAILTLHALNGGYILRVDVVFYDSVGANMSVLWYISHEESK